MRHEDKIHQAVAEAAIQLGRRFDMSEMPEASLLAIRAAQSASDELHVIIRSLTERRKGIEEDVRGMIFGFVLKTHGVKLDPDKQVGVQLDWVDKTIDVIDTDVVDEVVRKKKGGSK